MCIRDRIHLHTEVKEVCTQDEKVTGVLLSDGTFFEADTVVAVSYTHLDVYKRQELPLALLQTEANLTMLMAIRQRFPTELFLQEVQEKQQTS